MHQDIQRFRAEIDSAIAELAALSGKTLKSTVVEERIRQCFVTWSRLRASIESLGVAQSVIQQIDTHLETAARNAGRRIGRAVFRVQLREANKLLGQAFVTAAKQLPVARTQRMIEEIPDLPDEFIPRAIVGWKSKLKEFLQKHPFEQNVFIITRYHSRSAKLLKKVTDTISACSDASEKKFFPVVAKDHRLTDDLYNPIACLLCCRYAVAIFDEIEGLPTFNPNVAYELGVIHLLQRQNLILKSDTLKTMPSDILQKLYMPYSTLDNAASQVKEWLELNSPE